MDQPQKTRCEPEPTFEHSPLDFTQKSIRLLEVLPRNLADDPIRVTIRHATLEATYTCLSYVWGPAEPTHSIYINDRCFRVRENLYRFLEVASSNSARHQNLHVPRRPPNDPSHCFLFEQVTNALWIDAICIDQSNLCEKIHQIRLFGDIYSSAEQVVAWLGTSPKLRNLFKDWRSCFELHNSTHETTETWSMYHDLVKSLSVSYTGPAKDIETYFVENDYWTRAWITQEILRCRKLFITVADRALTMEKVLRAGRHIYLTSVYREYNAWEQLVDAAAAHFCNEVIDADTESSRDPSISGYLDQSYHSQTSSMELLWNCRKKYCTDIRDKIFSLLSVSTNGHEVDINYELPTEVIAIQFLRANKRAICLCNAVMVFDALEANVSGLMQSMDILNREDFIEVGYSIPWYSMDPSERAVESYAASKGKSREISAKGCPSKDEDLRLNLQCEHVNHAASRLDPHNHPEFGRPYRLRIFNSGYIRLEKSCLPKQHDPPKLVYPIYWEDMLTQSSKSFRADEHIYFGWNGDNKWFLRFSVQAFARLIELLIPLDKRLEYVQTSKCVMVDGEVKVRKPKNLKWTLSPQVNDSS